MAQKKQTLRQGLRHPKSGFVFSIRSSEELPSEDRFFRPSVPGSTELPVDTPRPLGHDEYPLVN